MTVYTEKCSRTIDANPVRVTTTLKLLITEWFRYQQLKHRVAIERRQLAQSSEAMLRDIGIDRIDAETEANRRDIPEFRKQALSNG